MLSYSDLSKSQKKWVDLVEIHYPEITETLTYQQVKDIHAFFQSKRAEDPRYKVSLALWLISNNATECGVYKFPASSVEKLTDDNAKPDTELEQNYKQALTRHGIDSPV